VRGRSRAPKDRSEDEGAGFLEAGRS
jgi:hypothetical protein